ncbi:MAG: PilZ domain-containing protein [Hyphomicrobiaceae bacterium]|nr:PilZ domain-containing protein [Hyphomicrobiaceae bacterium]
MSWQSARESASILAERLKKIDRRARPATADAASATASPPSALAPVYVKPSRTPAPSAELIAQAIDDDMGDLIEVETAPVTEAPAGPAANEEESSEHRRAPRKNQALPAYLTGAGMANIIPARVIDMSATGAKIELTPMGRSTGIPMTALPDRFVLVLRHDKMEVDCEAVWREEWLLGVRFLGFPRPQKDARR